MPITKPQQSQEIITPELKATFNEFLQGNTVTSMAPKSQTFFSKLISKFYLAQFHFDELDTKRMQRLLSYTNFHENCVKSDYCRDVEFKSQVFVIGALVASSVIPKRLVSKVFAGMLVLLLKVKYLDFLTFFYVIKHQATTNVLTKDSQEFRSVLSFYTQKRLTKEKNEGAKLYLQDMNEELLKHSSDFKIYQMRAHLL